MELMFRNLFIASVLSGTACAELVATFSQGDAKDVRMGLTFAALRRPSLSIITKIDKDCYSSQFWQ
jgi:hypothetical protein